MKHKLRDAVEKHIVRMCSTTFCSSKKFQTIEEMKELIIEKEKTIKISFDLLLHSLCQHDSYELALWLVETGRANVNAYRGFLIRTAIVNMRFDIVKKIYELGGRVISDGIIYELLFKRKNMAMLKLIYYNQPGLHNKHELNRILSKAGTLQAYSVDMVKFIISCGADDIAQVQAKIKPRLRSDVEWIKSLPAHVQLMLSY